MPSTGSSSSSANLRAGFRWSAARGEVDIATDIAAHAALMGFSVQLFETLAWAEELIDRGQHRRRPPPSPSVHGRGLRVLRRPGRGRRARTRTGDRAGGRTSLRSVRAGLRDVHRSAVRGLLRRPRSLCRAHGRGGARCTAGIGVTASPSYVDGLQVERSSRRGHRADRGIGRRARDARQSLLGLLRAVDRGQAFSKVDARARARRVGRGRGLRARAPRALLRRVPRAGRGPPPHVRRRTRGGARAVLRSHRCVPASGQRPSADHHARQRSGAVRTHRPPRAGCDTARRDVARAVELPPRSRARRSRHSPHPTARARRRPPSSRWPERRST